MPFVTRLFEQDGMMYADCRVGISQPREAILRSDGLPVPQVVPFRGLVDTGAHVTLIDEALVVPLGLSPTSQRMMHTASNHDAAHAFDEYDVSISVVIGEMAFTFHSMSVVVGNLRGKGIDALIGMDVLSHAHLVINGPERQFTLGM